jgi:hypothetical protein
MKSPRFPQLESLGTAVVDLARILYLLPKLGWYLGRIALVNLNIARLRREVEYHRRRLAITNTNTVVMPKGRCEPESLTNEISIWG